MFAALAGVAAGLLHVLSGPDHLAAVAPLAAQHAGARWRPGLQWGLGHSAGVLLIGVLLVTFRQMLPLDHISAYSERLVGLALLLVGVWGLLHPTTHNTRGGDPGRARAAHADLHTHRTGAASFAMGSLHGLAGSSHLFGLLPALALPSSQLAAAYLGGFGAGAVLGMTAFGALVGTISRRAERRGPVAQRSVRYACSCLALVTGGFWLVS